MDRKDLLITVAIGVVILVLMAFVLMAVPKVEAGGILEEVPGPSDLINHGIYLGVVEGRKDHGMTVRVWKLSQDGIDYLIFGNAFGLAVVEHRVGR